MPPSLCSSSRHKISNTLTSAIIYELIVDLLSEMELQLYYELRVAVVAMTDAFPCLLYIPKIIQV